MRTTLDIDADVLAAAKSIARRDRSTAGRVLSELARRALTQADREPTGRTTEAVVRYGVPVIPAGERPVTTEQVDDLMDEQGL